MSIHFQVAAVLAFALAVMRGTAFVSFCPPFNTSAIPFAAKTVIAAGLAIPAVSVLRHDRLPETTAGLLTAVALQLGIGALMGFVVQLFVGAAQAAGALIDQFSALNLPPSIDPLGLDQTPIIGQLYEWLATVLVFSSGGVLLIAEGLTRSFSVVGTVIPSATWNRVPTLLTGDATSFFAAAVEIAAPVVAVVFVSQILLGLVAKSAPQANVYSLSFPLQLLIVLAGLGAAVFAVPADVSNLLGRAVSQLVGG
jgi:flagellar biosynthetic protein FliR